VTDGKVYVAVSSQNEPYVAALDQATGAVLWTAPVLDPAKFNAAYQTTITAAPVVADGLIFQGIMAGEGSAGARGGYAILDAESGELIRQDWTITDAEYAAGYRGASIWCTGAYDEATKQVYACGGNPASKQREARHSNALLKFDLDPASPRFGDLVDAYKGTTDHYYPGLDQQPACDEVPTTLVWSPTCVQLDLDFGASPSLLTDHIGRTLVGDLQKSGIYHAAYADNMEQAWTAVVGTPGVPVNAASPAYDGTNVYTTAQMPGQIWGIEGDRGRIRWVQPLGEGTHYQSVSTANGVVYSLDNLGVLHAWDASNGVPVLAKPLSVDVGAHAGDLSSQGVSIAYNTIYAASSSYIVAYR
jgi:outer membrane protein assembly factor BamB